jgi:hypothetical protein
VSEPGHESTSSLDAQHIDQADATDRTPVVFIHGLWLLPSSWNRWASAFDEAGHVPVTPGWPDDPATVEEARAHPQVFAEKTVGQGGRSLQRTDWQAGQEAGGDRRTTQPRPRPGHRSRLARGRRHGSQLGSTFRIGGTTNRQLIDGST